MEKEETKKNLPDIKENDIFYIVRKKDNKSFYGWYYINDTDEYILLFDKVSFSHIDSINLSKYSDSVDIFINNYKIDEYSINDLGEVQKMMLNNRCNISVYKKNDYDEYKDPDDDSYEYYKMIEATRHKSFIDKITSELRDKFIRVDKHIDCNTHTTVFMHVDDVTVNRRESGYSTLRLNGKSLQVVYKSTLFGDNFSVLKGNVNSFVDLGSIDALMYLRHKDKSNWCPCVSVSKETCKEFFETEFLKNILKQIED